MQQYYDCQYLSPSESVWRIFAIDIHHHQPFVQRLNFHLEGDEQVVFNDDADLHSVLFWNRDKNTMFLSWMEENRDFHLGHYFTYIQFPSMFMYDSNERRWHPQQRA